MNLLSRRHLTPAGPPRRDAATAPVNHGRINSGGMVARGAGPDALPDPDDRTGRRPDLSGGHHLPEGATASPAGKPPALSRGQRLRLTATLSRQLQVLVATGTPLSQALHAVERTTRHAGFQSVIARLRHDVEEGTPLSVSMRATGVFDRVAVALVAAAETSGNMTVMLARLAELSRRQLRLRSAVSSALVYPCMLMTLGGAVLLTMLLFVLPRFEGLFASLDTPLPATTQVVMWASTALREHWLAGLAGLGLLAAAAVVAGRRPGLRDRVDTLVLRMPKLGDLARSLACARVARMLGTLLESKVPLLESLSLTREGTLSTGYARLLARAEDAVSRGEPLSSVFDSSDLIVAPVQEAVRNGEMSGQLGAPLCQLADFLDEENDQLVKTLTGLLEPTILIVLGLIVGFIAVSIFLPMFDLITAAQGGAG